MKRTGLGVDGEKIALDYLRCRGYIIHGHNFASRFGEIDIVAESDGFLCFIEVKTRGENSLFTGLEAVTSAKQQRIIKTAEYFLIQNKALLQFRGLQPRFDCIEIYVDLGNKPIKINHLKNAFQTN